MAKFSRYDLRNKKKDRHKKIYLNTEKRIHMVESTKGRDQWDHFDPFEENLKREKEKAE